MARPDHLFVFTYDIVRDHDRTRMADLLNDHLVRVQKSVFEGRMDADGARELARQAGIFLGPDDSLRVYCVPETGRRLSIVLGVGAMAEASDFWLF